MRGIVEASDGWVDNELAIHQLDNNFCPDTVSWDCRDIDEDGK